MRPMGGREGGIRVDPDNVPAEVRGWLREFDALIRARRWSNAAHSLCMLGVEHKPPALVSVEEAEDAVLGWCATHWREYRDEVRLSFDREVARKLLPFVRRDLRAHRTGAGVPVIFATEAYASQTEAWLVGLGS